MLLDGKKLSRFRLLSSAIKHHKRLPEQFSLSLRLIVMLLTNESCE